VQFKICPSCVALRPKQGSCSSCGGELIPLTEKNHQRLLELEAARRTRAWLYLLLGEKALSSDVAFDLLGRIPDEPFFPPAPPAPEPTPPPVAAAEVSLAVAVTPTVALEEPAPPGEVSEPAPAPRPSPLEVTDVPGLPDLSPDPVEHGEHEDRGGALAALVGVDEADDDGPGVGSWIYENIGWFLGATLVLAGSLYGVREAWQTLGDVPRHLVVSGALLGYHAGFVGVGAVVARRSQGPGRVLSGIGWLLLPVVFVALSSLVEASAATGLAVAALAGGLTWLTQGSIAARFGSTTGTRLAMATLPALAAMLPVASWPAGSWPRQLAPLLGLLGVALAARAADGWALAASVGAAAAAWLFSVTGAPGEAASTSSGALLAASALWVAGLSGLLREGLQREELASKRPALARGVGVIALAAAACAALAAQLGGRGGTPQEALVYLGAAAAATAVFARAQRGSPGAVHLLAPAAWVTGGLATRAMAPEAPTLWPVGSSLVAAGLLLAAARWARPGLLPWGLGLGALALGRIDPAAPPLHFLLTVAPLLLAAHRAASRWRAMHYAGGAVAAFLAYGVSGLLDPSGAFHLWLALATSLAYSAAAILADTPEETAEGARPLEDIALLAAGLAVLSTLGPPAAALPSGAPLDRWIAPGTLLRELAAGQRGLLLVAALLALRTSRDRGFLVGAAAALTLALAALRAGGGPDLLVSPHPLAALSLASALAGALLWRPPAPEAPRPRTRPLLGFLPLGPSHAPLAEGFGLASLALALASLSVIFPWMGAITEERRPFFVQAAALLCATGAVWFLTPGLALLKARGSLPALVGVGLLGVVTALANRLGRPLPPDQVAIRLTVVAISLWGVAELLARTGKHLGGWLGRPDHGERYHAVATVGLGAVGAVLLIDAGLLGATAPPVLGTIPPMLLLGGGLASLLLARRTRSDLPLHGALALLLGGLALAGAQQTLLGQPYTRLTEGSWYPQAMARKGFALAMATEPLVVLSPLRAGALLGAAAGAVGLALLALLGHRTALGGGAGRWLLGDERPKERLTAALQLWSVLGVLGCAASAGWQASRPSAALMAGAGLLIAGAGWGHLGVLLAGVGAGLLLHAQGFAGERFVFWVGPALGGLGLAALLGVEVRRREKAGEPLVAHLFAAATLGLGLLHGLSVGAPTTPDASLSALLVAADRGEAAGWLGSLAPALLLVELAAALALATRQAHRCKLGGYTTTLAAATAPALGGAFVVGWLARRLQGAGGLLDLPPTYSLGTLVAFVSPETTALAAGLAGLAVGAHGAARWIEAEEPRTGAGWGRDALLMATFCFASWHVARASGGALQPTLSSTFAGVGALAVVGLVSVHAAWKEASARHVYFVQLATVATYGVLRATTGRGLPPEADAIFALSLGFVLVGVTVLARRAKLPPVARATRLFAALLPLGVALALGNEQGYEKAAGALGSAMLYGALAWVERSRFLGALGAIAVNLALLLGALANGIDGLEIYLAPLGLFLLALGHLFAASLERPLRQWLRVLGSLLLYLPAGWSITFQLGLAPDARYPVVFGLVCLLGVAVGMLLRIRAYLVLGSAFLVLDVLANLLHAGLRNHRLGFLLLSGAGLLILGGMVLSTLQREAVQRLVRRYRARIASWD
jgi:hypothetical protein